MANGLKSEFEYFKTNHDELFEKYPNKYLVIKDKEVKFACDSFEEALGKAINNGYELGTFLTQLCSEGDKDYTQTFHSRVVFA